MKKNFPILRTDERTEGRTDGHSFQGVSDLGKFFSLLFFFFNMQDRRKNGLRWSRIPSSFCLFSFSWNPGSVCWWVFLELVPEVKNIKRSLSDLQGQLCDFFFSQFFIYFPGYLFRFFFHFHFFAVLSGLILYFFFLISDFLLKFFIFVGVNRRGVLAELPRLG